MTQFLKFTFIIFKNLNKLKILNFSILYLICVIIHHVFSLILIEFSNDEQFHYNFHLKIYKKYFVMSFEVIFIKTLW